MMSGDFTHCKTLEQFNSEIRALLEKHHGEGYTANHDEIAILASEIGSPCIVKELGVNQGSSFSSILLCPEVTCAIGIDIHPERSEPYRHLFREAGKHLVLIDQSSLGSAAVDIDCDILHIDSNHEEKHLLRELNLHAPHTRKYIVCHDVKHVPSLMNAILSFTKKNSQWSIKKIDKRSVGYAVLARI